MDLPALNALPVKRAREEFLCCCGSSRWAKIMAESRPFTDASRLLESASRIWNGLRPEDWLEAFRAHPRIGDKQVRHAWARSEQAGVTTASRTVREELAAGNRDYETKFGFIFLICATGKSAEEMLGCLRRRMENAPAAELRAAAREQDKITRLRLEKLLRS